MTGDISGIGTAYPSGTPAFSPGFQWSSFCSIFCFMCSALYIFVCPFVFCLLFIVLYVLRFTASGYSLGIVKHFVFALAQNLVKTLMKITISCFHQIQEYVELFTT